MDIITAVLTSPYTWIALELAAIAVLIFFVRKHSKRKKATIEAAEKLTKEHQYHELDEMLANKKRNMK